MGFGLPEALAAPAGVLLPLAELAVAAALLPVAWAWYGAIGALALLLLFVAAIAINLALGRTPDCHCFGQIHSEPVGWSTLLRNAALAAAAAFVVWRGSGPSLVGWLNDLTTVQRAAVAGGALGLVLVAAEAWLLLQMLRQQGRLLLRLDALEARLAGGAAQAGMPVPPAVPQLGLPVGSPAPGFRLDGLRGETLTLDALRAADKRVLLFFTHPSCVPCQGLMPDIGRWQREYASSITIALISEGSVEANRSKSAEHGVTQLLLQKGREVAEAYQAHGTPAALLVRPDGTIGSPLALGDDAVRALAAQALGLQAPAPSPPPNGNALPAPVAAPPAGPAIGQPAPPIKLPNLSGKTVDLASFRGRDTLVLFWNPGCGFCSQMLPDLKAWEARRPSSAPRILVVSTGDAQSNRAMGLKSPVLIDANFQVGPTYGANGTPMAVLVDGRGNIASQLAIGAPAVLALAGASTNSTPNLTA